MSRPLRVLHIGNGRAFKIRSIIDGLRARGHENHMIPIPPTPTAFPGVVWHDLGASPLPGQFAVLQRMWRVRRIVRSLRADVVHAHNAWGPGWYGAATGHHPYVIHAYGGDLLPEQYGGRPALQRRLTSWACRSADRIVVTGQHMVGASNALGIDPRRIAVLPRGVDVRRFRPGIDSSELRKQLGIDSRAIVIFSPRYQVDESLYNLDVVLDAFAELLTAIPGAVLVQMHAAAGVGSTETLRLRAERLGVADRYHLVPGVDNEAMPEYYAMADVTVSVPSSDGFPVTVLEASACACPLVVSDLPYCREWFTSGANGWLVPVRDVAALAAALVELCRNAPLRRAIGSAGRELVERRANYDDCMDGLERMYFELLAGFDRAQARTG